MFSEPVWNKRGYVGKTHCYRCFMCGYKAGTHITLNDQLPDGVRHGQKLFWNRASWGIFGI